MCTSMCIHLWMHVCLHVWACVCLYKYIQVTFICVCLCVGLYKYTQVTCICVSLCVGLYKYTQMTCICVSLCVGLYKYIYTSDLDLCLCVCGLVQVYTSDLYLCLSVWACTSIHKWLVSVSLCVGLFMCLVSIHSMYLQFLIHWFLSPHVCSPPVQTVESSPSQGVVSVSPDRRIVVWNIGTRLGFGFSFLLHFLSLLGGQGGDLLHSVNSAFLFCLAGSIFELVKLGQQYQPGSWVTSLTHTELGFPAPLAPPSLE